MPHTKFQGHWSIGSGDEVFIKIFTIYGHGGKVGREIPVAGIPSGNYR